MPQRASERWDAQRIAGVAGKRFIITGANSGLGFVTARELARAGADVTLAVRNEDKGREAAARISGSVDVEHLDLADLSSVRRFAESTAERGPIDVLINNAGIMYVPFATTADGSELKIGTNHLGHFALTNLLLPSITGKVVTLSSMAHRQADLDVEAGERTVYLGAQPQAGRRRLPRGRRRRPPRLQRHQPAGPLGEAAHGRRDAVCQPHGRSVRRDGRAANALYAAVEDIPGDSFVGPDGFSQMRGYPTLVSRSQAA